MARARKPGTAGKTKIPPDVVNTVCKRLQIAFRETDEEGFYELEVIPQQHYLYLETVERPREVLPGLIQARFAKQQRRTPLGRMIWAGDPEHWRLELYKWSDERWDERNDAGTTGGTPEQCIVEATLGWGR